MSPQVFTFDSMGTRWEITIWDSLTKSQFNTFQKEIISSAQKFDNTFSRFKKSSWVRKIEKKRGLIKTPATGIEMLMLYTKLYEDSGGLVTPLVGGTISDLGYDENYSLQKKKVVRKTPDYSSSFKIIDSEHIEKYEEFLFDFGALGKGFFVDIVSAYLYSQGIQNFLVNGSGDIYHQGVKKITVGLEHPDDPGKVIGKIDIKNRALCASAINRRNWKDGHHIINPKTRTSTDGEIIATFIVAQSAAIADGLATALFLSPPENFTEDFQFEYLMLNKNFKVKRSKGFDAELF